MLAVTQGSLSAGRSGPVPPVISAAAAVFI